MGRTLKDARRDYLVSMDYCHDLSYFYMLWPDCVCICLFGMSPEECLAFRAEAVETINASGQAVRG